MQIIRADIPDVLIIKPDFYRDSRGYFFESWNKETFARHGLSMEFVQDNESKSQKGVIRGLHFQVPPFEQGKLVRVVRGAVLDVAVDLRQNSPWYGKCTTVILTSQNKWMYWIPPGFAHGFLTLKDGTLFSYKCTQVYHKESEGCIRWNDPDLHIPWGISNPLVSSRDNHAPLFKDFTSPFTF
ncbi:MAG: dTDP-4-dehydrorhamnose 3,5-epimerase [Bacteroidales bacterium]|nr:dTDP-4-dehydrorhamnose 3,5-epimerase [Lentimicrobiaceae bacterium]MDD5695478.1 dTDP-4-dehydrorhamnose 3,5-epimerase [Bacteroidales bacterium]